jgi:DnaJ like chaperone protein
LSRFYFKIKNENFTIHRSVKYLSQRPANSRLYVLYKLLDIASEDKLLSNNEESFLFHLSEKLRIPKNSFQYIKASYIKKGLKDERTIEAEKRRKQAVQSYLPYNAYKVLGVTSSVSKEELKKVYRTLAKKFHPDKFHGKSEELITKAEEKFEEITRAYEFIKKQRKI